MNCKCDLMCAWWSCLGKACIFLPFNAIIFSVAGSIACGCGGGGGAGEAGGTDGARTGGDGASNDYRTGSNITYAGGGGGGMDSGGSQVAAAGGDGGGRLIAEGPPELVAKCVESYTGQFLSRILSVSKVKVRRRAIA